MIQNWSHQQTGGWSLQFGLILGLKILPQFLSHLKDTHNPYEVDIVHNII